MSANIESRSSGGDEQIQALQTEIERWKAKHAELEEDYVMLEREKHQVEEELADLVYLKHAAEGTNDHIISPLQDSTQPVDMSPHAPSEASDTNASREYQLESSVRQADHQVVSLYNQIEELKEERELENDLFHEKCESWGNVVLRAILRSLISLRLCSVGSLVHHWRLAQMKSVLAVTQQRLRNGSPVRRLNAELCLEKEQRQAQCRQHDAVVKHLVGQLGDKNHQLEELQGRLGDKEIAQFASLNQLQPNVIFEPTVESSATERRCCAW